MVQDPVKALFDTNILVDYLSGLDAAKKEVERYDERTISIVTWMEVLVGAANEAEADVIAMFLRDFRVVDLTRKIARKAVDMRRGGHRRIRLPDAIIWATAHVESALLITRNTRDFPADTPGVRVPY